MIGVMQYTKFYIKGQIAFSYSCCFCKIKCITIHLSYTDEKLTLKNPNVFNLELVNIVAGLTIFILSIELIKEREIIFRTDFKKSQ